MSIHVKPGDKRELAETLGRYFEARSMPFELDEHANGSLHIRFHADGHDTLVTVSFDDAAYDVFAHSSTGDKRRALTRVGQEFAQLMRHRRPTALAGDFHIRRF